MRIVILTILTLFLLAACSSQSNGTSRTTTSYAVKDVTNEAAPVPANSNPAKEFTMTAKNWEFNPSAITVNQGDTVRITIKSIDVDHGLAIPDFNVNVKLKPGDIKTVEFVADKKGEFRFYCNVYCGPGHREMEGTLIVS